MVCLDVWEGSRKNLSTLGPRSPFQLDLTGIDVCFTEEEIWATVKELPPDRPPGPDGFSGRFC